MDIYQPERPKPRARDRVMARRSKQVTLSSTEMIEDEIPIPPRRMIGWARQRPPEMPGHVETWQDRLMLKARDAWWYALHRPYLPQAAGILVVALCALFVLSHLFGARIFPNVWVLGTNIGDLTVEEASMALRAAWGNQVKIRLIDGEREWQVSPAEIGLQLDATATAESARAVGMAGMPMGYSVIPAVNLDLFVAQDYLLNMTQAANIAPYNAGYQWQGDTLVGLPGREGRVLDVGMTIENLKANPAGIAHRGEMSLVMTPLRPEFIDPEPYLEDAQALTSQAFSLTGYDPFTDEYMAWATDRDTFTSWIEAEADGLGLREDVFATFIEAQNRTLNTDPTGIRFMEPTETMDKLEAAIQAGRSTVQLRIRYRPARYEIEGGDTGYRIATRLGLPFYVLQSVNPGVNWEQLSIGDVINLPSRDLTLPIDPVPNKRIVVDIDTQSLVAYENGQVKFSWLISTGTDQAPTYPGIYQILTHNDTALGSTFELCGSSGCGQWEMSWFMGIYEVVPGLMNGFHGAVLLPNGNLLGNGFVGYPYTYGCVMSDNENAKMLYDWADQGTIVEIISNQYPPQSELGRQALSLITASNASNVM